MLGSSRFGDPQLERVYQVQQLIQSCTLLLHVLFVITAALLFLALNHLANPDLALLLFVILAASALILQAILLLASNETKPNVINLAIVWLFCVVIGTVAAGGQSALIPSIIANLILYTVIVLDLPITTFLAVSVSLIQIIGFVLFPVEPFTIHQLLATILIHGWCNFVGIYLYLTRNRLCRAAFLNARNALMSQKESVNESDKMERLLGSALPDHIISAVKSQIGINVPKLYVEHYTQTTVVYAKLYGLEAILGQISVQDAVRLLNEFDSKIEALVKKNGLIRIQSDAIIAVAGIPESENEHAEKACQFAWELVHLLRSFCEATTAEIYVKIGVGTGETSSGIIGANKWHYEIVGNALATAVEMEEKALPGQIFLTKSTAELVNATFGLENVDERCQRLIPTARVASTISNGLLFPNYRRFSLSTIPQAINRLLGAASVNPLGSNNKNSILVNSVEQRLLQGRRKKKIIENSNESFEEDDGEIINKWTLCFEDKSIEESFHLVIDRWFIPGLAISILFLVIYGLYQVLVMPRLIISLALIIFTLAVMFLILLMLYVNYFENFCYFITRTAVGHTISISLIITLLFVCGAVNVFSCPALRINPVCFNVFYSVLSCVLWMISTAVFIRYNSLCLIFALLAGTAIYTLQMFVSHPDLYINYSMTVGWRIEFDLIIGLATLSVFLYLQARRTEKVIRLDFLSLMKSVKEAKQLEWFEHLNEVILLNILPHHVAYSYINRPDPYCHLCHSVGILSLQIGQPSDWQSDNGFNKLNRLIYQLDKLLENFPGIEKIRSSNCNYAAAVGVLPEITRNVHDTPFTIGDLLAFLTDFALLSRKIIENEGVGVKIGIDYGSALSVVIGADRPRYDVIGMPCIRANVLMNAASEFGIIVSEEIYLALRPRNYNFAHNHPISVDQRLIGYTFADFLNQKVANPALRNVSTVNSISGSNDVQIHEETTQSTSVPMDLSPSPSDSRYFGSNFPVNATTIGVTAHNPLEMFTSMNSSMSSEMYSIDVSIESDSEIEWITPESMIYDKMKRETNGVGNNNVSPSNNRRFWPSIKSLSYKGDRAKQYSDFSETDLKEGSANLSRRQKKFKPSYSRNGPKIPSWFNSRTSLNSDVSQSLEGSLAALDQLNAAAKRVDRMLMELAHVDGSNGNVQDKPFPTVLGTYSSCKSINVGSKRELSSACHTEYDNAESDGACSDSEIVTFSRLEELKSVLKGFNNKPKNENKTNKRSARFANRTFSKTDAGNEADVDSNCSSLASSRMFDKYRWTSAHSIGYENEYEFANDLENGFADVVELPGQSKAVGADSDFTPMDADDSENEQEQNARQEVEAISRDICKNFGEFQLANFSDIDA
uniref:Adenylate cyclase n=1 Tax=Panagrolaimus sp. JU765 TaxID=591449 RepID=A0AC34QHI1_9BILA